VYIDGSATRKGGTLKAGVGLIWEHNSFQKSYHLQSKTSQYAELVGALLAVQTAIQQDITEFVICTDSAYTKDSFINYLPGWKRKGMRKPDGKPVANPELILAIDQLVSEHALKIYWKKVVGHSLVEGPEKQGNDQADRLAKEGA
ncbi:ribonuclease H1-like, partial [Huso huso]